MDLSGPSFGCLFVVDEDEDHGLCSGLSSQISHEHSNVHGVY